MLLLFTRTLSRFQSVNKFKPLLDAYQGPYKDKYYCWTGLQLLLRAVFFGAAALDKRINLIIGSIITSGVTALHGFVKPFKSNIANFQEILLLVNLQVMYILTLSGLGGVEVMIAMAALHITLMVTSKMATDKCIETVRCIVQYFNTTFRWIMMENSKRSNVKVKHLSLNNIPEVTYNYCEYQEPLVGVDQ